MAEDPLTRFKKENKKLMADTIRLLAIIESNLKKIRCNSYFLVSIFPSEYDFISIGFVKNL